MSVNKKINLTIDVQAELSNLQGQVNKIEKTLSTLKLPNNLAQNTAKDINLLLEKIKKTKEYTSNNQVDLVDEKKVQKELSDIEKLFNNIIGRVEKNASKIKFGDNKTANALRKGIDDYNKGISESITKLQKEQAQLRELEKEQSRLNKIAKESASPERAAQKTLKDAQKDLEKIEKERADYIKKGLKGTATPTQTKEWSPAKAEANAKQKFDKIIEERKKAVVNAEAALKKIQAETGEQVKKDADAYNEATSAVAKQSEAVQNLSEDLKELKNSQLENVKKELKELGVDVSAINSVEDLQTALDKVEKTDVGKVSEGIEGLGDDCQNAAKKAGDLGKGIDKDKESFGQLNDTLENFKNKAKYFFGIENAINLLRRAVQSAYSTIKDLDEVMTQTAVVTDFSIGDMWKQLPEYTKRANELGVSIHDVYESATLYYQQGLKTDEVMALSNETLKMARIANLNAADATSRMTNALRGFNMEINEMNAQRINDVYSKLAAITASDTNEISTAMTKVASLAHNANMEFETTSAFLAQMIETTRESAETAGTALKTVIARFSEVKKLYNQGDLMGTDEEGEEIDVNKVSVALRSAGINMNEYLTGAKGLDDIFIELASKWDKLDMVQQRYIATMAAGSRQQSRFIAMMSDYSRTVELVEAANTSAGASQQQFEKTLDSLQSKLAQLKNSWDTFLMGIANNQLVKLAIDTLTNFIELLNKMFSSIDKVTFGFGGMAGRIGLVAASLKTGGSIMDKVLEKGFTLLGNTKAVEKITEKREKGIINVTKALIKESMSEEGVSKATKESVKAIGASIVKYAKYSIAIAGVALAIYGIYKAYKALKGESPEEVLERAQKAAQDVSAQAQEAANAFNDLNDSLNGLGDKYKNLKDMTKGSREWRDAVREINDEVLNLMANYDNVKIINDNGVLRVENEDEVIAEAAKQYYGTQSAQIGAQQNVARAKQNVVSSNLLDELELAKAYEESEGKDYGNLREAPLNTSYLEKVAVKYIEGAFSGSEKEIADQIAKELNVDSSVITNDFLESLRELGTEVSNTTRQIDSYNSTLAGIAISAAELAEGTEKYASNFLNNNRMAKYQEEETKNLVEHFFDEDYLRRQLVEEGGYKRSEVEEMDESELFTQLASIRAQQRATKSVETFSKNLDGLNKEIKKIYAREDYATLTKNEVSDIVGDDFGFAKVYDIQSSALKAWEDMTDEERDAYESFKSFLSDYKKAIDNSNVAIKESEAAYRKIGLEEDNPLEGLLSGGAQKDLAEKLSSVFDVSGRLGAEEIRNEIANIIKENNLDFEDAEKFMQALKSIDWKNANAIDGLSDLIDGLGLTIEGLDEFEKKINNLNHATRKVDLEKVTEQLQKLNSLEASIVKGDRGFTGYSQEDVDKLIEAGMSASDFQIDPFSGTYTYIGKDLDEILTAIREQTTEIAGQEDLENKIKQGEIIQGLNEKYESLDKSNVSQYLLEYISKGGTEVSKDTVLANTFDRDKLLELAQGLQSFDTNLDNTTQQLYDLQKAQEVQEQILRNSIRENASENNAEAVMVQARNIGIPEELLKGKNLQEIASLGEVFEKATEFDIDFDQLEKYIKELKKVKEELNDVEVAQVALANTRLNRGLQQIIDTYEDWTALITETGIQMEDLDSVSAETVNNFKSSVKELLNMTEELPDAFFESEENLRNIQALAEGDTAALSKLRAAATESMVLDLDIDPNDYAEIQTFIDYIANVDPNMEVGAIINDKNFIDGLNRLVEVSGKSAREIAELFGSVTGFEFEPILKKIPMARAIGIGVGNAGGSAAGTGIQTGIEMVDVFAGFEPKYVGGPSSSISYAEPSGSGGGSGSEKNDTWENPYDELYNLTEKINEALRTREALERRYEKLVKKTGSTMGEVTKAYYDQIRHLRAEAELQKEMQAGRARQIENVGNEMYMDSEGNRSSFSSLGVTKYGSYDMSTGLLQIDWNALEALEGDPSKVEEGKAAEAYISRLEELQDQFEEVRDKLWDIEDQIEELREEAIENYLSFEDRVLDAVINKYQTQIDELSNLYDAIKNATDEIIKGVQEDVALSRQIRDNTKKEEDIANKEARLAYLRRDTSGANALEIKKLEDEITNARESYSDTLVDQQIQDMQNDANAAAEQRQHQIEIMQNQLEVAKKNGELWNEVWNLLNTATAGDGTFSQNSELVMLLEEAEAFQALSAVGQAKWWEEAAEAFKRAQVGLSEAEAKYGVDANADGSISSPDTSPALGSASSGYTGSSALSSSSSTSSQSEGNRNFSKVGEYEKPKAQMPADEVRYLQQALNDAGFTDANDNTLKTDGIYGPKTMEAVRKLQAAIGAKVDGYFGPDTRRLTMASRFNMYKTGGLADYTGPAWLDGSKTHPELVLNAKDTQNFIVLKDTLARLLGGQGAAGGLGGGDTYYNINIEADIGSDYDVTRLAEQIKKEIYNDSAYRNVNVINLSR